MSDTISHALADVIEVRSLTANNASQDDNGIKSIILAHLLCTINELKTTWNMLDVDVLRQCSMLLERVHRALKQSPSNLVVPISNHDTEVHIACVRDVNVD